MKQGVITCKFPGISKLTKIIEHKSEAALLKDLGRAKSASFFVDQGFYRTWQKNDFWQKLGSKRKVFLLPAGEFCKNWKTLERALSFLQKNAHERSNPIVVIGGGAACDLGAMAAGLYQRGTPLILIPTTMLAMLDAAVGGKAAIDSKSNSQLIKNFAGIFYPAERVILHKGFLKTLPRGERRSALGELCKMLWLVNYPTPIAAFREWLNRDLIDDSLWRALRFAIYTKAKIVEKDPLDKKGIRAVLNYGHTVGHAVEGYLRGAITHGEAVMLGMWLESEILSPAKKFSDEIKALSKELGFSLPKRLKKISAKHLQRFLLADKKRKNGKLEMQILTRRGQSKKFSVPVASFAKEIKNFLR